MVTPPDHEPDHEPDPAWVDAFARARTRVVARIARACERVGRDPSSVTLVAVSKTVEAGRLRAAVAAGITLLGENRVQEAVLKAPGVPGATWQLVGPLQSNKARRALETFASIQSVDSLDLAQRLDRLWSEMGDGRRYPVLVQVNVDLDPAKHGFPPGALASALPTLEDLVHLDVQGLMTVGRFTTDPALSRETFRELRAMSEGLRATGLALGPALSMGMTDDFDLAIEEGATIIRVGRALFGDRSAGG